MYHAWEHHLLQLFRTLKAIEESVVGISKYQDILHQQKAQEENVMGYLKR